MCWNLSGLSKTPLDIMKQYDLVQAVDLKYRRQDTPVRTELGDGN